MKIAVSGKGGVGKTTVSATLAHLYAQESRKVIAADVEPDANLGLALGFPEEVLDEILPISTMRKMISERTNASPDRTFYKLNPKVNDLVDLYGKEHNGVRLIALGTVETAGGGCVCPENTMLRMLLMDLVLAKKDVVILDMEAGLEHLGRGTASGMDQFVVVIEPGARSVQTYKNVKRLAQQLGVPRIGVVANKVRNETDEAFIRAQIPESELLGIIHFNENVMNAAMYPPLITAPSWYRKLLRSRPSWMRWTASHKRERTDFMKITVCGKGGCGKSTVTTLLAKELARMGKKVLVVDSDESNFGLHRQLGVELPRDFTEYFGGKDKAFKTMMTSGILDAMKLSAFAKKFFSEDFNMADIPEEYYSEKDGVKLMSSGKIYKANEGCACTMNSILEQFVAHLTLAEDEIALLDMEAGVEHFGRGTDNSVDGILMIVDPSFESLRLSAKIADLSTSIGKPIWFCLNKVTEEAAQMMEEEVGKHGAIIGRMPLNHDLSLAGLTGTELQMTIAPVSEMAQFLIQ